MKEGEPLLPKVSLLPKARPYQSFNIRAPPIHQCTLGPKDFWLPFPLPPFWRKIRISPDNVVKSFLVIRATLPTHYILVLGVEGQNPPIFELLVRPKGFQYFFSLGFYPPNKNPKSPKFPKYILCMKKIKAWLQRYNYKTPQVLKCWTLDENKQHNQIKDWKWSWIPSCYL